MTTIKTIIIFSIVASSTMYINMINIIDPDVAFPINISKSTSFILILNIGDKAAADHDPVAESCPQTKIISPIILEYFSFLLFFLFFYIPILLLA